MLLLHPYNPAQRAKRDSRIIIFLVIEKPSGNPWGLEYKITARSDFRLGQPKGWGHDGQPRPTRPQILQVPTVLRNVEVPSSFIRVELQEASASPGITKLFVAFPAMKNNELLID
jgi:hypothetical protein